MSDVTMEFVLMLTERDVTIPDALEVYGGLAVDGLRHVAFKDVGAEPGALAELTAAVRADGGSVLLEVADMSERGQEEGVQLAVDLGVERVVAAWRPDVADALKGDDTPEYWPFVGTLSGSPLALESTPEEMADQAREVTASGSVGGVVVMPYRQDAFDATALLGAVTAEVEVPVLVAGGVSGASQIERIAEAGAWGFTMGSALLRDRAADPASVGRRITEVLGICRDLPPMPRPNHRDRHRVGR
ncbi:hypothetical protein FH609_020800 [Streptomyces sp. 3MP-14]|uniref:Thiamine-phosphate pyrophosphorylase n=1 Tax=Streptomyces mimosae TaxID=2586635 RepID=A0A5N6A0L0_9ACTN|nr:MULTISPECIES: hypothetical protein [Streptomyces]KAB8161722.1 hypothetical protein FH607_023620 [Streptomyces mimosae]KAB8175010.1 hypothetical protein FH609_020800 [Streptomyces sp. 3MP-14]